MKDLRCENIRRPIPLKELERRWKAVRSEMNKQGIDCLIMQNNQMYLGGYVRYFTDYPAEMGLPMTVLFFIDGQIATISHGGYPLPPSPPEWAVPGVTNRLNRPYFTTFNFTATDEPELAITELKRHNIKRLGWVSRQSIHFFFGDYLKENLSGVEMIDATDLVDEIKAVKSEEEIELINEVTQLQDKVMAAVPSLVRPGIREYELQGELKRLAISLGSEEQWIMVGSAPPGTPGPLKHTFLQNREIQKRDIINVLLEFSGKGGMYTHMHRVFSLGEPTEGLLSVFHDSVELNDAAAKDLVSGAMPEEVFQTHNNLQVSMGYPPDRRIFAHGQGYDVMERPGIRIGEKMVIKAGMNIGIHSGLRTEEVYAQCCDNYIITDSGASILHKTPRVVVEI
jgi:Xaa-Pro aminopeptidase